MLFRINLLLFIAILIEALVKIEWSYPYCLSQSDGPAYPAYGFPLPYYIQNGVSSMEYDLMPHVYVLNIILIAIILYFLTLRIRLPDIKHLPNIVIYAFTSFNYSIIYYNCTTQFLVQNIGTQGYLNYSELRPVSLHLLDATNSKCKPSVYWFPDGWKHK